MNNINIRLLDYDADKEYIEDFNSHGEHFYPLTKDNFKIDLSEENIEIRREIDMYYNCESAESFVYGAFDGDILVGFIDGGPDGYCAVYPDSSGLSNQDYILCIEVRDDYRGKGIGTALFNRAFLEYPDSKWTGIIDSHNKDNMKLKSLYEHIGFDTSQWDDDEGWLYRDSNDMIDEKNKENEQIKKLSHDVKVGDPEKIGNIGNKIEQQSLKNDEKDLGE